VRLGAEKTGACAGGGNIGWSCGKGSAVFIWRTGGRSVEFEFEFEFEFEVGIEVDSENIG
jgi:hypothetical protein